MKVSHVRVLLVVFNFGLGNEVSSLPQWSDLTRTLEAATLLVRFSGINPTTTAGMIANFTNARPEALLTILQRLAQE